MTTNTNMLTKIKPNHVVTAYAMCMLIAWGPASLEEDRLEAMAKAECPSLWSEPTRVATCKMFARNEYRVVLKTLLWPFWLSYQAAARAAS